MKPFVAIYAKLLAKGNLSLNNWELCDKIGLKRPNLVVFDPILGILSF
jgi:hypothetical protein